MSHQQPFAGRTPPHSVEAEEYLLSCCLLDGNDTIARCFEGKLGASAFYVSANRIIYERLTELYNNGTAIDLAVLAEELKTSKQLDEVGGYAYLTQISGRIPTTAQASYFIEQVREKHQLRELIKFATRMVEGCYSGEGVETLIQSLEADLARRNEIAKNKTEFSLDDLLAFDPRSDVNCLLGKRYLCKTGSLLIVSQSGIGKSVIALQAAFRWSLGKDLFGIKPTRALRVLIIQAENDEGDVAEPAQGILKHYRISAGSSDMDTLRKNIKILRFPSESGIAFINRLRRELKLFPADIIIADPLFSFLGADIVDQRALSEFLRGQVNDLLFNTGAAIVFIHHTGKPPPKDAGKEKTDVDMSYAGIGSSELTNWARAVIVLQKEKKDSPVYRMILAKRGTRAGVVDENGQTQTRIYIEHGREGICWVPSSYSPQEKGDGNRFAEKYPISEMRKHYDPNFDWGDNVDRICKALGCDKKTVNRKRQEIEN